MSESHLGARGARTSSAGIERPVAGAFLWSRMASAGQG